MVETYKAACACGAVEAELAGAPLAQMYCHCTDCRAWLGAPMHAATGWPEAQVKFVKGADNVILYKRTEKSWRKSCKNCGGAVLVEHPQIGIVDVLASNIRRFKFEPAFHVYYGERMIDMKDGLPKYANMPKEMGGDGERVEE